MTSVSPMQSHKIPLALAVLATCFLASAPAHAQALADGKIMTIHMTTAARVFDMSPTGSEAPPGWMTPGFDDSSWDHATDVNIRTICDASSGGTPEDYHYYWGPHASDAYLFRQTFMVPRARSYYGSELDFTTLAGLFANGAKTPGLAINGKSLYPQVDFNGGGGRVAIVNYLHPGLNVLTAAVHQGSCSAAKDSITLRLTGLQRPYPLMLSWKPVKNAARYDVQVWLVKAAPGQATTPDSEVNMATQTTGPRATLDDAAMPAGTYQWRVAAVNAQGSLISGWTPAQTVSLN